LLIFQPSGEPLPGFSCAVGLTVSRSISDGMHEDLDVTNDSVKHINF
jgi:hypothetical protein